MRKRKELLQPREKHIQSLDNLEISTKKLDEMMATKHWYSILLFEIRIWSNIRLGDCNGVGRYISSLKLRITSGQRMKGFTEQTHMVVYLPFMYISNGSSIHNSL